jgi:SAM-dependent methyltransferase
VSATQFDEHKRAQWAGQAAAYESSFAALCAHPAGLLLDAANVGAGDRLLDVGTGTGTVAALAYARGAAVVAVDAEPSMVELARHRIPAAEVRQATLPQLPFADNSFDAAVANFVINHVGDPGAAVDELQRVVRPGGRLAVTIWPHPQPPAQELWTAIFAAAGVEAPTDLPKVAPDKDFPHTSDGLTGLLTRPGLTTIACDTITWTHHTDPEAWWNGTAHGLNTPGQVMRRQDPNTINRIRARYDERTAPYRTTDGRLALPTAALLASCSTAT